MRIIVCTTVPLSAEQVGEVIGADAESATVRVVVPAVNESALAHWVSDSDEAIEDADAIRRTVVEELRAAGVDAQGETGESDPVLAISDAAANFPPDRLVVVLHPEGERKHNEDQLLENLEERFGVPVRRVEVPERAAG